MKKNIYLPFQFGLVTLGFLCVTDDAVLAQVTSDGTVNTIVNENGNMAEITGGETRGSNLFHSFQDFSVATGNEAFFNNANDISNIFSRVTGGNISNIDGLISANGNASLFLINPAGIMFGQNASLNLGGSFYGSTADSILFNGGEFSAVDLDSPPLLTVNAPIGLSFRDNPAEINANDVGLEVSSGANIGLIGGNINLTGALLTAPGGRIELGGLNQAGNIDITEEGNFNFPSDVIKADLTLSEGALVDVTSDVGGLILAHANVLELTEGSSFRAQVPAGDGVNSGDINIEAESSFTLINSNLRTSISSDKSGDSGDITIKSPQVSLQDSSFISTSNSTGGDIGKIEIIDADNIALDNFSLITASSRPNSNLDFNGTDSNSGSVTLNSKSVSLTRGSIIDVTTANQINGGKITINADNLEISSGGILQTATEGTGNAGTVDLNIANSITIDGENAPSQPEESIRFDTDGDGVEDAVFFDDILNSREGTTGIFANTSNNGNAGEILINGNTFEISNNALLIARNPGNGNQADGGNVTLNIADSIVMKNGADINVEVAQNGIGNAGEVNIKANTFEILGGQTLLPIEGSRTSILAPNDGQGNAGTINIEANESIAISNSIITAPITQDAAGNTGEITITSPQVSVTDNALITVSSRGNAEGGSITIDGDNISIDNFSLIAASSRTEGSEGSGDITLNGQQVTLSNGGVINATTASEDNAGQITINAEILELFSGGVLQTATEGNGNAGNITLNISDRIILDGNNAPDQPVEFQMPNDTGGMAIFGESVLNNLEGRTGIFAGANDNNPSTGGNIEINTNVIVAFPGGNSDILANSQEGEGGNIIINAESLLGIAEGNADLGINTNDIDASSGIEGLDGTVTINTPDINPIQGATELPSNVVTPEQAVTQACQNSAAITAQGIFTIKARGGIPAAPGSPLNSETISINGEITPISHTPQSIETAQGKIQPARGIKKTKSGAIILTAYRTNNSGDRLPDHSCKSNSYQ